MACLKRDSYFFLSINGRLKFLNFIYYFPTKPETLKHSKAIGANYASLKGALPTLILLTGRSTIPLNEYGSRQAGPQPSPAKVL